MKLTVDSQKMKVGEPILYFGGDDSIKFQKNTRTDMKIYDAVDTD